MALVLATLNFLYFVPRDVELAPSALGYDVRAFYCAGAVANAGADPYLAGPLRACQHAVSRQYDSTSNVVIPAPAPGYTIALFRALAQLPFGAASWLWALVLLAATAVTVYALRGLSGFSWSVVIAAVAIGDCWVSLVTGQMVPVIVAGIALCALLLERKQPAWAAVAAAATMLEPHVGLAACLGIFVLVPRTRVALLGCAAALAFLSVAATGVAGNVEYFARALPAQVAAEVAAQEQYSVTYLLHRLGMPDGAAIAVGQAWYPVAVVAGIAAARRLVAGGLGVSLVALLPAAAAVIGGPYVHLHQIAAAMPAALVLAARVPERRVLFAWAVVLLAIPWGRFLDLRSPLVFVGIAWAVGADPITLKSLASKSVTTPIAMAVTEQIGGLPSLTAVFVILTGILGAIMVTPLFNAMRIRDMRARGFAVGLAAHGIGTARAFQVSDVAGAFAGIAMALNGIVTAVLVPLLANMF